MIINNKIVNVKILDDLVKEIYGDLDNKLSLKLNRLVNV